MRDRNIKFSSVKILKIMREYVDDGCFPYNLMKRKVSSSDFKSELEVH
jgi:hypothetical protein